VATFAVMITFGDAQKRAAVRPAHRDFLREQHEAGRLLESGPYTDESGALMIYQAESDAALRELIAQDPYNRTPGVLAKTEIKEWTIVFPYRKR